MKPGLHPLVGHVDQRTALGRAVAADRLPGSILVHGPVGIGRQRFGLWLAQLLLCETPGEEPCGECTACRLTLALEHPDLHWFFPVTRPRASGDRLAAALEDVRAAELQARREEPLRPSDVGDPVGLYLAQVQTIRRLASSRPAIGARQVFLIGNAEQLVPQESSPDAANALLKLLEEPPDGTVFILTAPDPDALLPTIRSRLLPVRLQPLPMDDVASFLQQQRGVDPDGATLAARLAQGSIGRALGFLPDDGEPGPLETIRQQARALLDAAATGQPESRLAAAHAEAPARARGAFYDALEALEIWCRDLAAAAAGHEVAVVNADALPWLRATATRRPGAERALPDLIDAIEEARRLASGNVNPQLILNSLLRRLAHTLTASPAPVRST